MCKRQEQAVRKGLAEKIEGVSDIIYTLYCSRCKTLLHAPTVFTGIYYFNEDLPEDKGAHPKLARDKIKFQPELLTVNFRRQ